MERINLTMLESQFKKKWQKKFKDAGWVVIQLDPTAGVPMGFPDTLILSPTGYHCFIEWKKSANAKKQPLQEYWSVKLNNMSHDAFFINPNNVEEMYAKIVQESNNSPR